MSRQSVIEASNGIISEFFSMRSRHRGAKRKKARLIRDFSELLCDLSFIYHFFIRWKRENRLYSNITAPWWRWIRSLYWRKSHRLVHRWRRKIFKVAETGRRWGWRERKSARGGVWRTVAIDHPLNQKRRPGHLDVLQGKRRKWRAIFWTQGLWWVEKYSDAIIFIFFLPSIFSVPISFEPMDSVIEYKEDQDVTLPCDVNGYPEPTTQWYHNGINLQEKLLSTSIFLLHFTISSWVSFSTCRRRI